VLCSVPVSAGGGACEGSESLERALAREEGLCSPTTPIGAVLPQGDFPWLHPFYESVCGHSLAQPVPGGPAAAEVGRALGGTQMVASAPVHELCWGAAGSSVIALLLLPSTVRDSSGRSLWGESGRGGDPLRTPSARLPASAPADRPRQAGGQHGSALLRARLGPSPSLLSLELCS